MKSYDKIPENDSILLDLPFYEGSGIVTRDQAKPHHIDVDLNDPGGGSFSWDALASGIGVLTFTVVGGGATDGVYLDLVSANCLDLDFVADDYSYGVWVKLTDNTQSQILIGRYTVNSKGWEIYWTKTAGIDYLTQRHHHAGTLVDGNPRSACYSVGWTDGIWHFLGISRTSGGEGLHYRNGSAVEMTTAGLVDPETSNDDLVIGCRTTKDANWVKGQMWRPRVWNRALSQKEWMNIFKRERDWFGI